MNQRKGIYINTDTYCYTSNTDGEFVFGADWTSVNRQVDLYCGGLASQSKSDDHGSWAALGVKS